MPAGQGRDLGTGQVVVTLYIFGREGDMLERHLDPVVAGRPAVGTDGNGDALAHIGGEVILEVQVISAGEAVGVLFQRRLRETDGFGIVGSHVHDYHAKVRGTLVGAGVHGEILVGIGDVLDTIDVGVLEELVHGVVLLVGVIVPDPESHAFALVFNVAFLFPLRRHEGAGPVGQAAAAPATAVFVHKQERSLLLDVVEGLAAEEFLAAHADVSEIHLVVCEVILANLTDDGHRTGLAEREGVILDGQVGEGEHAVGTGNQLLGADGGRDACERDVAVAGIQHAAGNHGVRHFKDRVQRDFPTGEKADGNGHRHGCVACFRELRYDCFLNLYIQRVRTVGGCGR